MSNVKTSEIEHFNQQASFWWDKNGPFKTLHHINPVRTNYVKSFVNLSEKSVLDVGCGGGVFSEAMAANNARVTGLDLASESLEVAKLHLYESLFKIDYINQSVEDFANNNENSFDVIVCMEMLEHVPDPQSIVNACTKLLKPGGWLFLSTINRNAKSMVLGIFMAEHVTGIVPKGTHHYDQFIKPSELVSGIELAQLQVKDVSGMKYNPLSKKAWIDSHDVSINYLIAAQKATIMKGFLFDLDGTLVDTAIDMIAALKLLAAKNGIDINPDYNDYKELITFGSRAIVTSIFGHLENSAIKNLQSQYLSIYENILHQNSSLFFGVAQVVKSLDNRNIPWGIVTNKPAYLAEPLVKAIKELNNCQVLIGGDTTKNPKPHPEPILHAIKVMKINPETSWYIGDALSDITAANAAQMNSAVALWGYLSKKDKPDTWQANKMLNDPLKILSLNHSTL